MQLGVYTRISKDDNGEQTSTERQEAECRKWAKANGHEVVAIYTDVGLSGYRVVDRPDFDRLLADVRAGVLEGVLVWKLDRLTRQGIRAVGRILEALDESGAELLSVHDPIDTSTALGEGVLGLLASIAKQESQNTSLRSKSAKRYAAENGAHKHGGPRAFGLTRDWSKTVPAEAKHIRQAAKRVVEGESLRSIVMAWNDKGVTTTTGRPWSTQSLRQLLLQPRLVGDRVHLGEVVATGEWPKILDRDTATRVRAVLTDPNRRAPTGGRTHLLTGLVRCSKCGGRMRASQPKGGKRKYACPPKPEGCNGTTILAEPLEEIVTDEAIGYIDSPRLDELLTSQLVSNDDDEPTELAEVEQRLDELAELWTDGEITKAEWLKARTRLTTRQDALRASLARRQRTTALSPYAGKSGALSRAWPHLSMEQRRNILAVAVDSIVIKPGTGGKVLGGRVVVDYR